MDKGEFRNRAKITSHCLRGHVAQALVPRRKSVSTRAHPRLYRLQPAVDFSPAAADLTSLAGVCAL